MKMTKLAALAAFSLLTFASGANANLITNGSFEANIQAANSWAIYPGLVGWNGGAGGIELRNNVAGAAYDGVNYVELDTTGNSLAYQNISTTLGTLYSLSFAYSPRENVAANSNGIEVLWNGASLGTFTGNGSPAGNNWSVQTIQVLGTSPFSNLEFRAVGVSESYGGSLDDVRLVEVPEPATLGMLGLGMLGLGFARRRKQAG